MSFKTWKLANDQLTLKGTNVLIVGGTQGIGAGVAHRFAQLGASVAIAGRNETLANQLIEQMKKESKTNGEFKFFKVDASLAKDTLRFCKEAESYFEKKGGIDHIIQTQGQLWRGNNDDTSEGMDVQFMTVHFSKWLILSKLLPIVKGTSIIIYNPGQSGSVDLKDTKNFLIGRASGQRSNAYLDASHKEFEEQYGSNGVRFFHLTPGAVVTDLLDNSGFPSFVGWLFTGLAKFIGRSIIEYSDHPVYLATNTAVKSARLNEKGSNFSSFEFMDNKESRQQLFKLNEEILKKLA